ncbi:hypothetical protein K7X08_025715 [Anisodus acutangulus]|uniref:Uncharacterized protein n=1 Tax=Anisodus acutangulus TaxID=402998 RepID=A0A9Q1LBT0_9SOLA|nr:hypothetical protein K7X08_025715 [Anisodus acutangulus]
MQKTKQIYFCPKISFWNVALSILVVSLISRLLFQWCRWCGNDETLIPLSLFCFLYLLSLLWTVATDPDSSHDFVSSAEESPVRSGSVCCCKINYQWLANC